MTAAGLSARLRAWLAGQQRPATARDALEAVDPKGCINTVSAALSAMEKAGLVHGAKLGARRYYTIGRPPRSRKVARAPKSGRADRVRALLQAQHRGYTVAELRALLDPQASSTQMAASLHTLAKQGHIARAIHGHLSCYARTKALAEAHLKASLAARAASKPKPAPKTRKAPAQRPPKRTAKPKPKPEPAARVTRGPTLTERQVARAGTPIASPPRRRTEPACAMHGIPDANRAASERIAADTAAFLAGGGQIERLGTTRVFKHIGVAANEEDTRARASGLRIANAAKRT